MAGNPLHLRDIRPQNRWTRARDAHPPAFTLIRDVSAERSGGGRGGGFTKNSPNQIFPFVNFTSSHDDIWVQRWGGGGGCSYASVHSHAPAPPDIVPQPELRKA